MGTLGTVGIADKGNYNPATTYVLGNSVYYGGSTWVAKKNNLTGITPEEGENWKYLARGFGSDSLSQIEATDTSGVLGTSGATVVSQALIDAIADKVMTKLIPYTNIVNNFLATDPNTVLSGPMGKSLKDQLDTTNSNFVNSQDTIYNAATLFPSLNWTSNSIFIKRQKSVKISAATITSIVNGATILTLPANLVPAVEQRRKTAIIHTNNSFDFADIVIKTNGEIALFCQLYNENSAITPLELEYSLQ